MLFYYSYYYAEKFNFYINIKSYGLYLNYASLKIRFLVSHTKGIRENCVFIVRFEFGDMSGGMFLLKNSVFILRGACKKLNALMKENFKLLTYLHYSCMSYLN